MNSAIAPTTSHDVAAQEAATTLPVYDQLPFVAVRGSGCFIHTLDDRNILDLYGGHAVAGLGYNHADLTQAVQQQWEDLAFQSNAVVQPTRAEAAARLVGVAPNGLTRTFFANSGSEANENALRLACAITGRSKVIAIEHGFHGRTAAAAAVTWKSDRWYGFPQAPFNVEFIPRNDVSAIDRLIDDSTAAVIFEPIQGIAGAFDLSSEFVAGLRAATTAAGALLIADEVQCGMGRSGRYFACSGLGVSPDLLTVAKALGGGFPCAALLTTDAVSESVYVGQLGSTFGGGPVAAAAIVAVINAIEKEGLLSNVRAREQQVREQACVGPVQAVQGTGLLLGLRTSIPAAHVRDRLLEQNILVGTSADPNVVRLLPPLTLESEHVNQLVSALAEISN
ncbi:MAG: aminotransferase class III-fold pyridoxal phosphate-dependent enzyme [Pseudomonadota bacterium]